MFNCGGGASGYISKKNITIKNIAFEGANQTAFFAWDGANITVQNCTFNNNRNGIYMWNIASSKTDGNSVTNILNTAIEQRGKVSKPTVITNNVIKNVSLFAGMGTSGDDNGTAIMQDGNNSTIHYNRIDSIGYNGITWQGNNVSIKYNYVTNFLLVKDDGGGIYTWNGGNAKRYDRVIDHNIVVGAIGESYGAPGNNQSARCIYLDDNTNFTTVTNNTVSLLRVPVSIAAILLAPGYLITQFIIYRWAFLFSVSQIPIYAEMIPLLQILFIQPYQIFFIGMVR